MYINEFNVCKQTFVWNQEEGDNKHIEMLWDIKLSFIDSGQFT